MKSIASVLSIIALGFGLVGCTGSGGGSGEDGPPAFAVSTITADFGVVSNPYTSTLAATGGTAPFTWSLFTGALPAGLSLNASTGAVAGTPVAPVGNFTATFTVTDSTGQTATGTVLFSIHPRTDLLSVNNSVPPVPGVGASSAPSISSNGRFVAFASSASLIPGVVGSQIYIHDWQTNQTSLVSRNAVGIAGNGDSSQPTISSNGQFVAFTSLATNLAATLGGSGTQIFLRDTQANITTLVSQVGLGNAGDGASSQPTISSNGQFVAFTSLATNLAATLGGSGTQIFLRDTQANTTTLVSQTTVGGNAGNGPSSQPTMSDNGGFVAFSSLSTNLGALGGNQQIYVRAVP